MFGARANGVTRVRAVRSRGMRTAHATRAGTNAADAKKSARATGARAARRMTTRVGAAVAPFEFQTATRMVFGRGAFDRVPALVRELAELEGVDVARNPVLIVTGESTRFSKPLEEKLVGELGASAKTFRCPRGEPTVASAISCIEFATENECGIVIAVGGGTAVDTAKCVAAMITNGGAEPDLYEFLEVVGRAQPLTKRTAPFIAIPTTAGPGAEVAKNSVLEAGDRKVSMRHPFMLPSVAVRFIIRRRFICSRSLRVVASLRVVLASSRAMD